MKDTKLSNPPLIEAIFEITWQHHSSFPQHNPHYSLLIGQIYDRIGSDYPIHQELPTATIPSDMLNGVVQHRFRTEREQWPLVQLGPGIFTLNDTERYTWADFENRALAAVKVLLEIQPNIEINNLSLRYINGIDFDFKNDNVFQFLKEKLKIDISLHPPLFQNSGVASSALQFNQLFTFECSKPKSTISLRLARGKKKGNDALILEMMINASSTDETIQNLNQWLDDAHNVLEDWFFKLIEGDLLTEYQ